MKQINCEINPYVCYCMLQRFMAGIFTYLPPKLIPAVHTYIPSHDTG